MKVANYISKKATKNLFHVVACNTVKWYSVLQWCQMMENNAIRLKIYPHVLYISLEFPEKLKVVLASHEDHFSSKWFLKHELVMKSPIACDTEWNIMIYETQQQPGVHHLSVSHLCKSDFDSDMIDVVCFASCCQNELLLPHHRKNDSRWLLWKWTCCVLCKMGTSSLLLPC